MEGPATSSNYVPTAEDTKINNTSHYPLKPELIWYPVFL